MSLLFRFHCPRRPGSFTQGTMMSSARNVRFCYSGETKVSCNFPTHTLRRDFRVRNKTTLSTLQANYTANMPSRRPEKNYSPHKRGRIMQMVELGYTAKEVAEKERVNPRTAYGIASRYRVQKRGQSRDRSGCPTKISEREKRHIMRLIEADPFIHNEDICRRARLSCCTRTLTRWLRSEGI
jgi:transposase